MVGSGRSCPVLGKTRPKLVALVICLADLSRTWPKFGQRRTWICQRTLPHVGQNWPTSAKIGPKSDICCWNSERASDAHFGACVGAPRSRTSGQPLSGSAERRLWANQGGRKNTPEVRRPEPASLGSDLDETAAPFDAQVRLRSIFRPNPSSAGPILDKSRATPRRPAPPSGLQAHVSDLIVKCPH